MKTKYLISYLFGCVLILGGLAVGAVRTRHLFLPTFSEYVGALLPTVVLITVGTVLIVLSFVLKKRTHKNAVEKANYTADGYTEATYSYETAHEAILARITAWEKVDTIDGKQKQMLLSAMNHLAVCIKDISKMSSWISVSLDDSLNTIAKDAVMGVDRNKLKLLSDFISYCACLTDYEIKRDYLYKNCEIVTRELTKALELYANMRSNLSSFGSSQEDINQIKEAVRQSTNVNFENRFN